MDRDARSRVYALALAQLQRWAHGRLPRTVRNMTDTADLVQDTFVEALKHFDGLDDIDRGALNAYLRGALKNRISDEIRRAHRRPATDSLDERGPDIEGFPDVDPQKMLIYREALQRLPKQDRAIIVARVELGLSFEDIADEMQLPSPDAARIAATKALMRLAEEMRGGGDPLPR